MTDSTAHPRLIVILGDQLSPDIAALRSGDPQRDIVLMAEVRAETDYVPHHKKKIAFIFAAMRHFAAALREKGWTVDYVPLDAPTNRGSLTAETERAVADHGCAQIICTEPGEWRLQKAFEELGETQPVTLLDDDRFLCPREDFAAWWEGRRQPRMEHFYRQMRRRTGLLMEGDKPVGGRWNFDSENRKPPPGGTVFPEPSRFVPDAITEDVLMLVERHFGSNFGRLEPFWFGVTHAEAAAAFDHFVTTCLPGFGDYQDAMTLQSPFLYHAVISLYLNVGLLDPRQVYARVDAAYRSGDVPLNAAEGFIRQIIGWREYVRGLYWQTMPDYAARNHFGHTVPLPEFYWTGETEMTCLRACIAQTRDEAYAHHIQRLMVTGNFAMLAGIDPQAVHEWYLSVYADAFEWVELPNTLGMSQFADGGLLGSKPYAASGNYINRMSDYCKSCRYKVKEKTGPDACPFNYLYWDFLDRNRDRLRGNPRLAQVYRTWDRMDTDRQKRSAPRRATLFGRLALIQITRPHVNPIKYEGSMEKLHHIALPVNDIDEAVDWYRKNFDVEPVHTDESWALLAFENVALALVLPHQHPAHIAVERTDAEKLGPLTRHRDGTRSTYVQDPWGNAIEYVEATS